MAEGRGEGGARTIFVGRAKHGDGVEVEVTILY